MIRRKSKPYSRPNHDRWLVSYADFITLLFAFFVVLFAASTADNQKAGEVAKAVKGAFAVFPESSTAVPLFDEGGLPLPFNEAESSRTMDALTAQLETELRNTIVNGKVRLSRDSRGLTISLTEAGFFHPGSAALQPEAYAVIDQIAATILKVSNNIRVEGHTDNTPIHTAQFPSNWELSTARATHLLQYLISTSKLPPQRLSAVGYGEYHPAVSNATPDGRAANRRVDLVILGSAAGKLEPDQKN